MSIGWGFVAGLLSGFFMALVSDIAHRLRFFGSSLIAVDGSFAVRMMGKNPQGQPRPLVYCLGIVIHLVTSGIFGAVYAVLTNLFQFDPGNVVLFAIYVLLLWLAMLFSALPIAGLGVLGRGAGRFTWLEQLLLHMVFAGVFWHLI
ncbi:MAG TPA: hypothetical protein DCR97_12335 [Deltaproteobacteria bacterium]|nr:hypothetical protein [Deltaproteobacteria bacterium]